MTCLDMKYMTNAAELSTSSLSFIYTTLFFTN